MEPQELTYSTCFQKDSGHHEEKAIWTIGPNLDLSGENYNIGIVLGRRVIDNLLSFQ
jgi:hypothetical protein